MYEMERSRLIICQNMGDEELVCPKPRHAVAGIHPGALEMIKPVRRLRSHTPTLVEAEAGHEILDILFCKLNTGEAGPRGSTVPIFCGSPPNRAGNPLIHDVQFAKKRGPSVAPLKFSRNSGVNTSVKSACSSSYGPNPFVRIVGFAPSNTGAHQGVPAFA